MVYNINRGDGFIHALQHSFMKSADQISKELNAQRKIFTVSLDCCHHCDALITRHHVLPPVVTASSSYPKAPQPGIVVQSLNVHGLLPTEFPVGAETLHNLCLGLLGRLVPYLLQLLGELLLVSLLWLTAAGLCSRSQHSWHLKPCTWLQAPLPFFFF
uniref:Uncharacterized protein n=1 Tax=Sphaerodactylus townsendi TaxID=933632 RepID=A0ACB8F683_9SAUR